MITRLIFPQSLTAMLPNRILLGVVDPTFFYLNGRKMQFAKIWQRYTHMLCDKDMKLTLGHKQYVARY